MRKDSRFLFPLLLGAMALGGAGFYGFPATARVQAVSEASPLSFASTQSTAVRSAKMSPIRGGFHLTFDDPGWDSGIEVRPSTGTASWNLSTWEILAVDVKNLSRDRQQRLVMTVFAMDDNGKERNVTVGVGVNPGETRTLRLPLPHPWKYGAPSGIPSMRTLDTAKITRITVAMQWPFEKTTKSLIDCDITNLRVEQKLDPTQGVDAASYLPFIDRYGQFVHGDWPGKIKNDADLRARLQKEDTDLARAGRPASWDRFGGWKDGPQLKATGSFRTEKYDGKWWMVDPEGRLFLSQGLDVISANGESLQVPPGKENWFESVPTGAKSYSAVKQNLQIKYGSDDYQAAYYPRLAKRLESWGINSLGDWSSPDLMALGKTPYTLQLTDYDYKMPKIQGSKLKFYDVFDPAYIQKMKTLVQTAAATNPMVTKSLTDPMCIGYFIDNELNFGNRGKMTLVDDILRSPATQASKREFVSDLKSKYTTIAALNKAWQTTYTDWDTLLSETTIVPDSAGYHADAWVFFRKVVDQYFRLAKDAVKSVAPNRLYLGARFISTDAVRKELYDASYKYCDILSVNIYAHSAANFPSAGFPDMPVMVTEFQFGLIQRGMLSASLCQAGVTTEDRSLAYTRFLQGVLTHPNMVGAQYFQYRDQPLTGRGDGERYQIGFVDVTDTPYTEMTSAARAIGEGMYTYRKNGKLVNTTMVGK